jgi:hypothetical protein
MNLIEIVSELNSQIMDIAGEEYGEFEYRTNGDIDTILFCGYVLWRSDEEERDTDEDGDWEPLLPYIKKAYNKYIREMAKNKLK